MKRLTDKILKINILSHYSQKRLKNTETRHKTRPPIVNSWNEWDPLEEVIVGIPHQAVIPSLDIVSQACFGKIQTDNFLMKYSGKFWSDVVPKEVWDKILLENRELVRIFQGEGVRVVQPEPMDMMKERVTPYFTSKGLDMAFPRDIILVVGNNIIETPMTWPSRWFEFMGLRKLMLQYWQLGKNDEMNWITPPKTTGRSEMFKQNYVISGDIQSQGYVLTEFEPSFDAADFMRCGKDIFAQRSHVSNLSGIQWLKSFLKPQGIRVHLMDFQDPHAMHIDTTFFTIKPGLAIQNPTKENPMKDQLRKAGWDLIPAALPTDRSELYEGMLSRWTSMNVIMLDENRVLVEARELPLIKQFEKLGIICILVDFSASLSMGGGLHCWTSDIRRTGTMQSYFDWPDEILEASERNLLDFI